MDMCQLLTGLGVGELKIKYTIFVLVWVLPAKAELEKKKTHLGLLS